MNFSLETCYTYIYKIYNAVTYLTDHELGRSADGRLASAWFGGNAKRKVDALELALEMAG
jgi:hypothetical protein